MSALEPGTIAPEIALPSLNGSSFSLEAARQRGPVLVAFFKVSCPTCQYTFPFLERIHKAYPGENVTVFGVSQNERADTAAFAEKFGITFPLCLDDTRAYPVSNQYGLTNVPTIFFISPEGKIEITSVGWLRADIDDLSKRLAAASGVAPARIFQHKEEVVEYMSA
ncbi:MAG: TlpA family protein disulfide reductase [Acidobacteria bacterium]|nr:TlpA family protein disulfide reductase [Acidobacteriota bacterium]